MAGGKAQQLQNQAAKCNNGSQAAKPGSEVQQRKSGSITRQRGSTPETRQHSPAARCNNGSQAEKYLQGLPLLDGDVFPLVRDAAICRTDDAAAFEVQFLVAVGTPADDAGHCKQRSEYLPWYAYEVVNKARVEVHIGT